MRTSAIVLTLAAASLFACSSAGTGDATKAPTPPAGSGSTGGNTPDTSPVVSTDTTWGDGQVISEPTLIDAGSTVTIAAGAKITVVDGVTITVKGTLKSVGGAQAKITGNTWVGLVVAAGGTLALDGVDIENATAAVDVQASAKSAKYDKGTITSSLAPFVVELKGALSTSHATVVSSRGTSHIQGDFTASYLAYDANGFDGITAENDEATLSIEDSTLQGGGGVSDFIVSYQGAKNIHVAYTEITKVHCAFHLERVTGLDVSHVTAQSDSFGFMMYGSLNTGTKTIASSNFTGLFGWGIHELDTSINGPISVTGNYFNGNGLGDVHLHAASKIVVTDDATSRILDAAPR